MTVLGGLALSGAMVGCMGNDGSPSSYAPTANSASARVASDSSDSGAVPTGVDSTLMRIRHNMDSVLAVDRHLLDSIMQSSGMDSIRAARREKMDSVLALRKAHRDSVLDSLFHARDSIAANWKMDTTADSSLFRFHGGFHRFYRRFRR